MSDPYLWLKALHIAGFAAWMAGMWYLPRLFVYHTETEPRTEASELFKVMERRLLRFITTPAMIVTWLGGLGMIALAGMPGGWLHLKLVFVVLLSGVHGLLAAHVKKFGRDERPKPARWYRAVNEVPTVLFLGIVFLAVLRPF
ncbi:protoporphyrinogen oxidase HemJ [Marinivivus vitaminiproducens]|uniref:protoporphyrinogen oxidase HemJ n=1 Tax=Marinivivus vitaminiproducens TaxID=3035935 RepID=UPI00279BB31D|nr:protoporphyrinogen oxidase HemJ [Geminicoccaceae bacterium SCSIO 64248]